MSLLDERDIMTHYPNGEPPSPKDGDTCTVFRPEYDRHELWVREGSRWCYLTQGTPDDCNALAAEYGPYES